MISTSPSLNGNCFPSRSAPGHPTTGATFFVTAQKLVDNYGKEHVLALVNELVLADAGATTVMADPIRHSVRA